MPPHRLMRAGALVLTGTLVCLTVGVATRAKAQAAQLLLTSPQDADCSSPEVLQRQIEARLGRAVFGVQETSTRSIVVDIQSVQGVGWQAALTVADQEGQTGSRQLHSSEPSCTALDTALVLVIATLLGPEPSEPAPSEPPPAPAQPAYEPPPRHRGRPSLVSPAQPWTVRATLGGALGSGLLPSPYLGAAVGLLGERGPLTLRTSLLAFPRAELSLGGDASARFAALLGQAAACAVGLTRPRGRLSLCAGGRAGALYVRSAGLAGNQQRRVASADLELTVRYDGWSRGRLGWYTAAGASFPLLTQRFFYIEQDERPRYYHSTKPGISCELGMILRLSP